MIARPIATLIAALLLSSAAVAQPGPPLEGRADGDRPPPPRQRDDRGPGGDRPGPGGRPGGPAEARPGGFEAMRGYLDLVDRYSRLSRDPTAAAVAAVVQTADVLRPRGAQAVIDHFEKLLPEVKNEAVARAIRLQLVDLYRQTQQGEKALDQLSQLIKGAPAGPAADAASPTPQPR